MKSTAEGSKAGVYGLRSIAYGARPAIGVQRPQACPPVWSWTNTHTHRNPGVALSMRKARRSNPDQSHGRGSLRIAPPNRLPPLCRIVTSSRSEPLPSTRFTVSWDTLLVASPGFETALTQGFAPKMLSIESNFRTAAVCPILARPALSRSAVTVEVVPFTYDHGPGTRSNVPS